MNLRDKMTPKTDEQIYEILKSRKNPNTLDIAILDKSGRSDLVSRLAQDENVDSSIRGKWHGLLKNNSYDKLKKIDEPTIESIVSAMKDDEFSLIMELLDDPNLDSDIRIKWKKLLKRFFKG